MLNKETEKQKRNTDLKFVGIEQMKTKQREQLKKFEQLASSQQWEAIHTDHYDWWMFPIDSRSGKGLRWTVYAGDIEELKQDEAYLRDYLRGVELLMAAWGWDLYRQAFLPHPAPDQRWHGWPVRIYKAAYSLWLFGYDKEFTSLRKYALILIEDGVSMMYSEIDLGEFFKLGVNPYNKRQVYQPTSLP